MCGIAGMSCRPGITPDAAALDAMARALRHRGPDGEGRWMDGGAALVHRRLSIVDLAGGAQPIMADGAALIANGEIYNDPELRTSMPDIVFATGSDCEPALHLWTGDTGAGGGDPDFARRLRGMFAIGLLRSGGTGHEIVLARDPFGIKPIYYASSADGIAFASEPNALLDAGFGERRAREEASRELLQAQFTTGAQTIYPGILRVLPGETIRIIDGAIVSQRRTTPLASGGGPGTFFPRPGRRLGDGPALDMLDAALCDSVRAHLRADVPLGMFLSGGIDSAAVLAAMRRVGAIRPVAWTARFDVPGAADETDTASTVARAAGADHRVFTLTRAMVWRDLPRIVACLDDPVADYATIPTWYLAREAARDVKVVLSGEGGDELFAGYGRYRRAMKPWWRGGRDTWTRGALASLGVLRRDDASWRAGIVAGDIASMSRLERAQARDVAQWLPNDLLLKLDRCLMAHGVEGRTPLLDPVVARAAALLGEGQKIRDGMGKWMLRQWLAREMPQARPFARKQGFTVPVGDWIAQEGSRQGGRLGTMIAALPCIARIAHPDRVAALFADPAARGARRGAWALLFYALWHRLHIEGVDPSGDVFDTLAP